MTIFKNFTLFFRDAAVFVPRINFVILYALNQGRVYQYVDGNNSLQMNSLFCCVQDKYSLHPSVDLVTSLPMGQKWMSKPRRTRQQGDSFIQQRLTELFLGGRHWLHTGENDSVYDTVPALWGIQDSCPEKGIMLS